MIPYIIAGWCYPTPLDMEQCGGALGGGIIEHSVRTSRVVFSFQFLILFFAPAQISFLLVF